MAKDTIGSSWQKNKKRYCYCVIIRIKWSCPSRLSAFSPYWAMHKLPALKKKNPKRVYERRQQASTLKTASSKGMLSWTSEYHITLFIFIPKSIMWIQSVVLLFVLWRNFIALSPSHFLSLPFCLFVGSFVLFAQKKKYTNQTKKASKLTVTKKALKTIFMKFFFSVSTSRFFCSILPKKMCAWNNIKLYCPPFCEWYKNWRRYFAIS